MLSAIAGFMKTGLSVDSVYTLLMNTIYLSNSTTVPVPEAEGSFFQETQGIKVSPFVQCTPMQRRGFGNGAESEAAIAEA